MKNAKIISGRAECQADVDKLIGLIVKDRTMLLNSYTVKNKEGTLVKLTDLEFQMEFGLPVDCEEVISHAREIGNGGESLVKTLQPVPLMENTAISSVVKH